MQRDDILVEVRDRDLVRRGQITSKYLKLKANVRASAVGSWQLTLPGAHPMVPYLGEPGSGIVVSHRKQTKPAAPASWERGNDSRGRVYASDLVNYVPVSRPVAGTQWDIGGAGATIGFPTVDGAVVAEATRVNADPYVLRIGHNSLGLPQNQQTHVAVSARRVGGLSQATELQVRNGVSTAALAQSTIVLTEEWQTFFLPYTRPSTGFSNTFSIVVRSLGGAVGEKIQVRLAGAIATTFLGSTVDTQVLFDRDTPDDPADGPGFEYIDYVSTYSLRVPNTLTGPPTPAEYGWDTLFSGPTSKPTRSRNREQPDGTFVFEGVTDEQLLADARAFPEPSNPDVSTQSVANDVRVGSAETLMREYVSANIGPAAPVERKVGSMREFIAISQPDTERGPIITKSPRFQILAELLSEIATLAGLGFRMVQRGDFIEFEVVDIVDRSGFVRFDIANGTLTSEQVEVTPPSLTRAIVAGQGEGAQRTIIGRTSLDSQLAEIEWGRIIERFIDQRDTDDLVELQQSGDEALIEEGFVATNVKVVPADDTTMRFVHEWNVGDIVTVVVNGQETKTNVTEAVILVDETKSVVGAGIGDVRGFDAKDALTKRVEDTERKVDKLERTAEALSGNELQQLINAAAAAARDAADPIGNVRVWPGDNVPDADHMFAEGQSLAKAEYPELFAVLGSLYGSTTTHFNLPNTKGRVIVARDSAVVALDTVGKTGGVRDVTLTVAQIPSHSHQQFVTANAGGTAIRNDYDSDTNGGIYDQGITTGATGGGQSHTNMQPYIVMKHIIRVK